MMLHKYRKTALIEALVHECDEEDVESALAYAWGDIDEL